MFVLINVMLKKKLQKKDLNNKCDDINFEEEIIKILEFGFERIGIRFLNLKSHRNKDELFNEIGHCFKGFANRMRIFKDDLKK